MNSIFAFELQTFIVQCFQRLNKKNPVKLIESFLKDISYLKGAKWHEVMKHAPRMEKFHSAWKNSISYENDKLQNTWRILSLDDTSDCL